MKCIKAYCLCFLFVFFCGCGAFVSDQYRPSLPHMDGVESVRDLKKTVRVRRDNFSVPLLETSNDDDLAFATGYISATHRLAQMVMMARLSQGRLSELIGPGAIETDQLMRSINFSQSAGIHLAASSEETRRHYQFYADGVNSYIDSHLRHLPPELSDPKYTLSHWTPNDSACVVLLAAWFMGGNIDDELYGLQVLHKTGADKAGILLPTPHYPGASSVEAEKLNSFSYDQLMPSASALSKLFTDLGQVTGYGRMGSQAWAVTGRRTASGRAILACDFNLPLSAPSPFFIMQKRSPRLTSAGAMIPGAPDFIIGYNKHIAWGADVKTGDTQDLFIEKLTYINGTLHFLDNTVWQPCIKRMETFKVLNSSDVSRPVWETKRGPLLNSGYIRETQGETIYGIALKWTGSRPDKTLDALYALNHSKNISSARSAVLEMKGFPVTFLISDGNEILMQVAGQYPDRKKGFGLLPSPSWDSRFGWEGTQSGRRLPFISGKHKGYLALANQPLVSPNYPVFFSSRWDAHFRQEQLISEIKDKSKHDLASAMNISKSTTSRWAIKVKEILLQGAMGDRVRTATQGLEPEHQKNALWALSAISGFNGIMAEDSPDAAVFTAFSNRLIRNLFEDDFGGDHADLWQVFSAMNVLKYNAYMDQILMLDEAAPFWDNHGTMEKETPDIIVARSLSDAVADLQELLGDNKEEWRLGAIQSYQWRSMNSVLSSRMTGSERRTVSSLNRFFDRGPFAAAGDSTTVFLSASPIAEKNGISLAPGLRMMVDFTKRGCLKMINTPGNTGNPADPFFDAAIAVWAEGDYLDIPFEDSAVLEQYYHVLELVPGFPGKGLTDTSKDLPNL